MFEYLQINSVDSLEKLDLSYNGLKEMSYDAFDNLDSLKYLMLSHNNIESVGDDIFEWNPLGLKVVLSWKITFEVKQTSHYYK